MNIEEIFKVLQKCKEIIKMLYTRGYSKKTFLGLSPVLYDFIYKHFRLKLRKIGAILPQEKCHDKIAPGKVTLKKRRKSAEEKMPQEKCRGKTPRQNN